MTRKILVVALQIIVAMITIPAVALATMSFENRNNDGPSIVFPGGELVSGELYSGPEPDWGFTNEVSTIHLQLDNPLSSRLIWIEESDGKVYITSDYMGTWLGRRWENTGQSRLMRATGSRLFVSMEFVMSENSLEFFYSALLDGVIDKKIAKYRSRITREAIESGETWVFELAPREGV